MVLSNVPFHSLAFPACAILSVPIEFDWCALVKTRALSAFSSLGGKEPGRGEPPSASYPLLLWILSAGWEPAGAPGVCHHVAERASKGDLRDELQLPITSRNREGGVWRGRRQSHF